MNETKIKKPNHWLMAIKHGLIPEYVQGGLEPFWGNGTLEFIGKTLVDLEEMGASDFKLVGYGIMAFEDNSEIGVLAFDVKGSHVLFEKAVMATTSSNFDITWAMRDRAYIIIN